ncbi:nuclear transport factor 2 family protein [Streptomyces thinghirensis]|nr:nuclear transport factor 2 family protein [Streptomyces thinghirensis]
MAARHAERADAERVLPQAVAEAVIDAGFARHYVPVRRGGAAGGTGDLLRAVSAVAEGCTSAAWCASVTAGAARMGAYLPEEGRARAVGQGPDTVVVGALIPRGGATPVAGGWRVTGEWSFTSAVDFSDWALVCALAPQDGKQVRGSSPCRATTTGWRTPGPRSACAGRAATPSSSTTSSSPHTRSSPAGHDRRPQRRLRSPLPHRPLAPAQRCALRRTRARCRPRGAARMGRAHGLGRRHREPRPGRHPGPRHHRHRRRSPAAGTRRAGGRRPQGVPVEQLRDPPDCAYAVEQLVDVVERLLRTAGSSAQLAGHPSSGSGATSTAWPAMSPCASTRGGRLQDAAAGRRRAARPSLTSDDHADRATGTPSDRRPFRTGPAHLHDRHSSGKAVFMSDVPPHPGTPEPFVSAELYARVQQFYARQMGLIDDGRPADWAETFTEDATFQEASRLDAPLKGPHRDPRVLHRPAGPTGRQQDRLPALAGHARRPPPSRTARCTPVPTRWPCAPRAAAPRHLRQRRLPRPPGTGGRRLARSGARPVPRRLRPRLRRFP